MWRQGKKDLVLFIRSQIERSPERAISFYDYMTYCLYHPEWGYYMDGRPKLGKSGDFYTSASVGSLMGETLAEWICSVPGEERGDGPLTLVEWGGGTGKLARDVLDTLKARSPKLYEEVRYISV